MSLTIRSARPGEGALILGFIRELADYERLAHEVVADEAAIETAVFGADPAVFCEIAEWDGEPVGYAVWLRNFSTFSGRHGIYLEDLFVRPSHRGRGVGHALMRHLACKCVANGWRQFEWAVLGWNAPSIAFYTARGAMIDTEWRICRLNGQALDRLAAED